MMNPPTRLTTAARRGLAPAIEMQLALIQECERLAFENANNAFLLSAIGAAVKDSDPSKPETAAEVLQKVRDILNVKEKQ